MTLDRDRKREKNLRPPMRKATLIVILAVIAVVFGYVIWWSIAIGPTRF